MQSIMPFSRFSTKQIRRQFADCKVFAIKTFKAIIYHPICLSYFEWITPQLDQYWNLVDWHHKLVCTRIDQQARRLNARLVSSPVGSGGKAKATHTSKQAAEIRQHARQRGPLLLRRVRLGPPFWTLATTLCSLSRRRPVARKTGGSRPHRVERRVGSERSCWRPLAIVVVVDHQLGLPQTEVVVLRWCSEPRRRGGFFCTLRPLRPAVSRVTAVFLVK